MATITIESSHVQDMAIGPWLVSSKDRDPADYTFHLLVNLNKVFGDAYTGQPMIPMPYNTDNSGTPVDFSDATKTLLRERLLPVLSHQDGLTDGTTTYLEQMKTQLLHLFTNGTTPVTLNEEKVQAFLTGTVGDSMVTKTFSSDQLAELLTAAARGKERNTELEGGVHQLQLMEGDRLCCRLNVQVTSSVQVSSKQVWVIQFEQNEVVDHTLAYVLP